MSGLGGGYLDEENDPCSQFRFQQMFNLQTVRYLLNVPLTNDIFIKTLSYRKIEMHYLFHNVFIA